MYEGYFEIGGQEVGNRQRAKGYADTADCPVSWFKQADCDGIEDALGDDPYTYDLITSAPWYDPGVPESARFFGVYPLSISGLSDSTVTGTSTEGLTDGGITGSVRNAIRQVRIVAVLAARGMDALEAGMSWLKAVLAPATCSTHSGSCGSQDACFFVMCPGGQRFAESNEDFQDRVDGLTRRIHGVTTISGPLVRSQLLRRTGGFAEDDVVGYEVEWTMNVDTPFVYSLARPLNLLPAPPVLIEDAITNRVPYGTAELLAPDDLVRVAVNLCTNPSLEVDATGWTATTDSASGSSPTPYFSAARNTAFGHVGSASFLTAITGNGTTIASGACRIVVTVDTPLSGAYYEPTSSLSLSIWGKADRGAKPVASVIGNMYAGYQFFNGSTPLGIELQFGGMALGSPAFPSMERLFSTIGIVPPPTATKIRVNLYQEVSLWRSNSSSSLNSTFTFRADALGVMQP